MYNFLKIFKKFEWKLLENYSTILESKNGKN